MKLLADIFNQDKMSANTVIKPSWEGACQCIYACVFVGALRMIDGAPIPYDLQLNILKQTEKAVRCTRERRTALLLETHTHTQRESVND